MLRAERPCFYSICGGASSVSWEMRRVVVTSSEMRREVILSSSASWERGRVMVAISERRRGW